MTPPLIAVIGPVEPALLTAWTEHYRALGVDRFLIAFHFPDHVPGPHREALITAAADLGTGPRLIGTGPWHEDTNTELREQLRAAAGPGWHIFADSDEFHQHPVSLTHTLAHADQRGQVTVGGLLLDRISDTGELTGLDTVTGLDDLDRTFPLGGYLTHTILRGDPRKIIAARDDVIVSSGQHRAPGNRPDLDQLACVHHFKWRRGVLADLHRRICRFGSGEWAERSPAVRDEAARLLDHVGRHHGRIDPTNPRPGYRPVSLAHLPDGWAVQARSIASQWQPDTTTKEG